MRKIWGVTDGNGNVTTNGYDGFDRALTTTYADGSYEQLGYDANGNVTSRRLRDGQSIAYTYDALNRLTLRDRPQSVGWEGDQSYAYDLVGNLTRASDTSGRILGFSYDALGRKTAQTDNWYGGSTTSFQYDAAGRRTRLTWQDGAYISYAYLTTGEMSTITSSGGTQLVSFGYDDLGRRTSLSRANGTTTSYAYDPVSRLSQLTQDLAGSASDLTLGFSYNPASQISSRASSNDAYVWTGSYNVDRSYGVNGLNQLTSAGATALAYDGRGNLKTSGTSSYTYNVDNQMAVAKGVTLAFDPLGRFFYGGIDPGGITTSISFDGPDVLIERNHDTGARLRRYVYGPGTDEPLIWYEGSGFSDRRWLHADERGSIIAVSNDAGNAIQINTYDEYGVPGANNLGRFQYTGQKFLPTIGLYDYKARMYSPTLGRFMQTDPIGYGDGINWYNYVGSDPINKSDPSGLNRICTIRDTSYLAGGNSYVQSEKNCYDIPEPQSGVFNDSRGGGTATQANSTTQRTPCSPPAGSLVGAARLVVGTTQNVIDGLVVASAASGIGEPLAAGLTVLNDVFEVGLLGVNAYDAFVNGDSGSLKAQAAALPVRLLPAGRLFQSGLRGARGSTGILRNARGQFRSSYLNNPGIREAGQTGAEKAAGAAAESITCAAR